MGLIHTYVGDDGAGGDLRVAVQLERGEAGDAGHGVHRLVRYAAVGEVQGAQLRGVRRP
jgi:hypothetical protein